MDSACILDTKSEEIFDRLNQGEAVIIFKTPDGFTKIFSARRLEAFDGIVRFTDENGITYFLCANNCMVMRRRALRRKEDYPDKNFDDIIDTQGKE